MQKVNSEILISASNGPLNGISASTQNPKVEAAMAERRELFHNLFRDFTWAGLPANFGLSGGVFPDLSFAQSPKELLGSAAFLQPTLAQWTIASAVMFAAALTEMVFDLYHGVEMTWERLSKIWTPAIAASIAIPMWNLGATLGSYLSTFASACFAGVFEGFTQFFVKYLLTTVTDPVTRKMWQEEPIFMLMRFGRDLALNITIGAIPGLVWKVAFVLLSATLIATLGPIGAFIVLGILVAGPVMVANKVTSIAIASISAIHDKKMGWDKRYNELREKCSLNPPVPPALAGNLQPLLSVNH